MHAAATPPNQEENRKAINAEKESLRAGMRQDASRGTKDSCLANRSMSLKALCPLQDTERKDRITRPYADGASAADTEPGRRRHRQRRSAAGYVADR